MAAQIQNIVRQASLQNPEGHSIQQAPQSQPFEASQQAQLTVEQLRQHQFAQQKAQLQQRMASEQANAPSPGLQGPPGHLQMPPSYLQNQIMRQRQAAANAAANWAAQQDRSAAGAPPTTQRLGSAILRLLNFSEQLNSFAEPGNLDAWKRFVEEFYIDPALCMQSLPSNPELSYELPTPLLPAYFHQMHREIVKLNLTFHDAREYYLPPQSHVVECPKCTLCYYFKNVTKIEILGRLRIVFTPGPPPNFPLKMESWEFIGEEWDEWICRMPPPPLNGQDSNEGPPSNDTKEKDVTMEDSEEPDDSAAAKGREEREQGSEEDEDNHEDLFGRSPTQDPESRRSSTADKGHRKNSIASEASEDPKSKDPNTRARMVMSNGVTERHLRFLEISDVLGQLSPLFGRKSPKETLANLLQSLPKLPEEDATGSVGAKSNKTAAGKQTKPGERSSDKASTNSQKFQQIQAGRAMQQQAAQLLQKQAAQTLSQALPPANLEFPETSNGCESAEAGTMPDDEDLFASNASSEPPESAQMHIKEEEVDQDAVDEDDVIAAGLEADFELPDNLGADEDDDQEEEKLDLQRLEPISEDAPGAGCKRPADEAMGRIKRQRNEEDASSSSS